eukprot:TRINITY_DN8639_c0_g1_i1.p1 TRINITY_DN8639_c0_g1~~TRINITY_DN8639_c0_g1_i1.p1  ORF type:complete len:341 (+),score=138.98 TRINITY_DN8639_c0_g1_i1:80-1024(+)
MTESTKLSYPDLKGRVAIVTGGSRGIGRSCCLALASRGCAVVVAAKSTESSSSLPGSIFSVAEEVRKLGAPALACRVDLRDIASVQKCVDDTIDRFGRVDIVALNASALWWHDIEDTPMEKYDLITGINSRGHFMLVRLCMPHMKRNKFGRVVAMSPPIQSDYKRFKGMTAYNISKMGMTMVAMGAAAEGEGHNVCGYSLWPATVVESQASINFKLMPKEYWRKATVLSDAVVSLAGEPPSYTGKQLIDDEYLASRGLSEEDLKVYRVDPDTAPPRALDPSAKVTFKSVKRGDVRRLKGDMQRTGELPAPAAKL